MRSSTLLGQRCFCVAMVYRLIREPQALGAGSPWHRPRNIVQKGKKVDDRSIELDRRQECIPNLPDQQVSGIAQAVSCRGISYLKNVAENVL